MNKDTLIGIVCACTLGWFYFEPHRIEEIRSRMEQFIYHTQKYRTPAQIAKDLDARGNDVQGFPSKKSMITPTCISETIEGVPFFYSSTRARQEYHDALELILDNITPEPNQRIRQERMKYIQSLTFNAMFGIPDSDQIEGMYLIDENRAMNLKLYLLQKYKN